MMQTEAKTLHELEKYFACRILLRKIISFYAPKMLIKMTLTTNNTEAFLRAPCRANALKSLQRPRLSVGH